MKSDYTKVFYKDYEKLFNSNEKLKRDNARLNEENRRIFLEYQIALDHKEKADKEIEKQKEELEDKEAQIDALKREVARLNAVLNNDGSNSGTPTSKTPIHKKKIVPNTREKTGKSKGGQYGHPKAKLKAFEEKEITEHVEHGYECCPECGGELECTGEAFKDETDYEVVVIKRRHHFKKYVCKKCGKEIKHKIPDNLKEENQYGASTQALALSLMNIGNVSVNKVRRIISGLSQGDVEPTDGYIIKLQSRAANMLKPFVEELKRKCLQMKTLYWDDTVIFISTKRACLRFYGNERIALFCAHMHKNKEGIDADGILPLLSEDTAVMHDHNIVNYNDDYGFTNIECNQHLLRDLQKVTDNLNRRWSQKLKAHIQGAIHDRNIAIEKGEKKFSCQYINDFFREYSSIMISANQEHDANPAYYYYNEEESLILRIMEYKNNYFAWVTCFDLPITNNVSERSLRGSKTHMKVSGQFQSEEYARNYAIIQSYIETCKRNGINEMTALTRLCSGMPFSVSDILSNPNSD